MAEDKISGVQKLVTKVVRPDLAARMEADSRLWMVQCARCGYERSIWEMGGVRYKAAGTSRRYLRCLQCGKKSWHKVYRTMVALGATSAPDALSSPPADAVGRRFSLSRGLIGLILGLAVFFTVMPFLIIALVNALTQPVVTAGDSFMSALKTGDYAQAYNLCTPDLQKELGNASEIVTLARNHQPAHWNWTSRSIRNGVGRVNGSFTETDGKAGIAHLEFRQVGESWKVSRFLLDMK